MAAKRFFLLVVLALAGAIVLVPGAGAGNFDEPRMGCTGENPATCPTGTTGQPYTLPIELSGDEDEGCAVFSVTSGSLPPGLSLTRSVVNETGYGLISGTPTQAGTWDFFLSVTYNREVACPFKPASDDSFRISINPGVPKLTIGPQSAPVGTVNAPYSLQMTATVDDPKTWTIADGALPPGLAIGRTNGLITGTPTTSGSYAFMVRAEINPQRVDTKWLTIEIRDPLSVAFPETETTVGVRTRWEVGVPLELTLSVTGGSGSYTWTLAGALPAGVELTADGMIVGRPLEAGSYRFATIASDSEGRKALYAGRFLISSRLTVARTLVVRRPGKVGRPYLARIKATGGVLPKTWAVFSGTLPSGVQLDPQLGTLRGVPMEAGRFRVTFEVTDALDVTSKRTYKLIVKPKPKPKKQPKLEKKRKR